MILPTARSVMMHTVGIISGTVMLTMRWKRLAPSMVADS